MSDVVVAVYVCAASIFTVVASFALLAIIVDAYGQNIKKLLRRKKGGEGE